MNWTIWIVSILILVSVGAGTHATAGKRHHIAAGEATAISPSGVPRSAHRKPPNRKLPPQRRTPRATTSASPTATPSERPRPHEGDTIRSGVVLPNRFRTPGAINRTVTEATIDQTICVPGWTATVRPDSSYTTALKEQQLASGYTYHRDLSTGDYEEDHLISLELGGAPSSPRNLWPEPYAAATGARVKDRIENKLHDLVCAHDITLAAAQRAIATNWWAAYQRYDAAGVTPPPPSATASGPAPAPHAGVPAGATGICNDGTYSYALHHQGMCSHHGGVGQYLD